ncbi:Holliday junction recognition protein [Colius striatus]|uniref:Holliday junction recognition protein n=1 Tax=Colius striatus TaxID=57412 RepID=UPI002B1E280C|nr:Holliday junction recognition protein [Colius striatus]
MAFDLEQWLCHSNIRFVASIKRIVERYNHPFQDDFLVSMETLTYNTPEGPKTWGEVSTRKLKKWRKKILKHDRGSQRNADQESDADIVSIRRKFEDIHFQNPCVEDGKNQEKGQVKVDVIVQDYTREIPRWIMMAPQGSSGDLHLSLPLQELIGNQEAVCRKKELSNECSSSRHLQLEFSGIPIPPDTITLHRHRPSPEMNKTCWDSIVEEYQSADEECSWNSATLADLYPAMVEIFTRLMTKQFQRRELRCAFGHLRHRKWWSRRPKLNFTIDKIRQLRPFKLKQALPSICSSRSEDIHNQTFRNENREPNSINNLSSVPHSYIDTDEIKIDYTDSSLEHHFFSGKGQKVSKQAVFPNGIARMGETFLVEDEVQTAVSLKNSKCKGSEKLAYKCSSEHRFASSGPTAPHLVEKCKTQKLDFPCDATTVLCSSTCSSYGSSNSLTPVSSSSLTRTSNTLLINPEKIIPERQISLQCKHSFSSLSMKQSPSKMPQKYEDAFENLYYKLSSNEIQKPLSSTRPLSNSQNLEEKGRQVKCSLSVSVRSDTQYDREFDRIYEQLCSKAVRKLPGFQRASNLRKYEGVQMSETVNALVNSPIQTFSAISRIKRLGNFQNGLLCSPVKRLKSIPECYFPSTKRQQLCRRKNLKLHSVDTDFLSTYKDSNSSFFDSHISESMDSGCHASSDKTFIVPHTSLQESGITDAHSGWLEAMKNYSLPGNRQKCHQRVSRKLSYTDGKD